MRIRAVAGDIAHVEADAVVANLFEGVEKPGGATAAVDHALGGAISSLISRGEIKGKAGEVGIIHTLGRMPAGIVAVAGLGKSQDFTADRIRGVAGDFSRELRKLNCRRIATILHGAGEGGIELAVSAQAIAEGALLGLYSFDRYRKPEHHDIEDMLFVVQDRGSVALVERSIDRAIVVAEAANLARTMVDEPSNYMTPGRMAQTAEELANRYDLELKVLEVRDMEVLGMGALLAVARGSSEPPKMIVLSYRGDEHSEKGIGFLGKGITFDSGGISIKPSEGMGEMKQDMAGAAAAMAALGAVAGLRLPVNATAVIPATENLPSGTALKPGDVLRAMNGKTIEVISTDAEGRLILADALSYAQKLGLSPLIDLATLTGACRVALGTSYAGLFSNSQALADEVLGAAGRTGERMWQMPMPEEYRELLKSEIADIKNGGFKLGGAIMAALFLAEFTDETPWVHIDIAGPASSTKESGYLVKGATGFGVRTLVEFAIGQGKSKEAT